MRELLGAARWHEMTALLALLGDYWTHAILSSLVSVLAAQAVARVWPRRSPNLTSRLAFLSVMLPAFVVPLYAFALGGPGGIRRSMALIRTDGWLHLVAGRYAWVIWVVVPLALLSALPFAYVALVGMVRSRRQQWQPGEDAELAGRAMAASRSVTAAMGFLPRVVVVRRSEPVAWVSGLFRPTVLLGEQLVRLLDQEELEVVIAHECAHIKRGDTWIGYLALVGRAVLLFNPAVTWACWQMSVQTEQACDRWAADRTRRHLALGSALIKIHRAAHRWTPGLAEVVEDVRLSMRLWEGTAHRTLLRDRVERLLRSEDAGDSVLPGLITMAGIVLLALFFVG